MTTAIYPNRIEDKNNLESHFSKLSEEGNESLEFYYRNSHLGLILIAKGYNRVVYGDHGPYVEFEPRHILVPLISKFGNNVDFNNIPDNPKYYYYWMQYMYYPIKFYFQLKTVKKCPNAPYRKDGKPYKFNRIEGYADYKIGKIYVDPYEFGIIK
jgi:hypothetical protein